MVKDVGMTHILYESAVLWQSHPLIQWYNITQYCVQHNSDISWMWIVVLTHNRRPHTSTLRVRSYEVSIMNILKNMLYYAIIGQNCNEITVILQPSVSLNYHQLSPCMITNLITPLVGGVCYRFNSSKTHKIEIYNLERLRRTNGSIYLLHNSRT